MLSINYAELPYIIRLSKKIGIKRLSILRFVPHGRGRQISNLELSYSQNIKLQSIVRKYTKNNKKLKIRIYLKVQIELNRLIIQVNWGRRSNNNL